eukprot:scaffold17812_cov36-Tisochrysis_lutea.AAC.2
MVVRCLFTLSISAISRAPASPRPQRESVIPRSATLCFSPSAIAFTLKSEGRSVRAHERCFSKRRGRQAGMKSVARMTADTHPIKTDRVVREAQYLQVRVLLQHVAQGLSSLSRDLLRDCERHGATVANWVMGVRAVAIGSAG